MLHGFFSRFPFVVILLSGLITSSTFAQATPKRERARLPKWETFPSHVFFKDAFAEGLVGPRPASLGQLTATRATTSVAKAASRPSNAGNVWSSVVSSQTLEDEIKSLQIQIQKTITTPSEFSGGGYLEARRMFTELAALFSVISEYDGDVRWKSEAPKARDLFTRAAANTKTTSIQAFNEAKKRKQDLEELVRGGKLGEQDASVESSWKLINRASLMQRFTQSYDEGIAIWTAKDVEFQKSAGKIRREAELLMMLSVVLRQAGMEDGDDEDYAAYCKQLEKTTRLVLQALDDGDADASRKATSAIGQSCNACHEDYRG